MNTVFIGGSRHVSRLPPEVKKRLDNVVASGHRVVVGDANGADKAVQKHLFERSYDKVTVFCSGEPRNNVGMWQVQKITPPKSVKGFQFYAAKDREMAREADFGLMIWDGKSPGTVLNVLRLVRAGKISVLFHSIEKRAINIKSPLDWNAFLQNCSGDLVHDLRERATSDEWSPGEQGGLLKLVDEVPAADKDPPAVSRDEAHAALNAALAACDPAAFLSTLGSLAKAHGMSQVAKETGLARESLYRALGGGGNPEFATVLKVVSSLGIRLAAGVPAVAEVVAVSAPSDVVHGCQLTSRQNKAFELKRMAVMVEHVAPDLRPLLESISCDSKAEACYSVTLHPCSREAADAIAQQLEAGSKTAGGGGGHNGIDVSGNDGGNVDRDPCWYWSEAAAAPG